MKKYFYFVIFTIGTFFYWSQAIWLDRLYQKYYLVMNSTVPEFEYQVALILSFIAGILVIKNFWQRRYGKKMEITLIATMGVFILCSVIFTSSLLIYPIVGGIVWGLRGIFGKVRPKVENAEDKIVKRRKKK